MQLFGFPGDGIHRTHLLTDKTTDTIIMNISDLSDRDQVGNNVCRAYRDAQAAVRTSAIVYPGEKTVYGDGIIGTDLLTFSAGSTTRTTDLPGI